MMWLPYAEDSMMMLSRFDTTPERDGQTDERTDGQTDISRKANTALCNT